MGVVMLFRFMNVGCFIVNKYMLCLDKYSYFVVLFYVEVMCSGDKWFKWYVGIWLMFNL